MPGWVAALTPLSVDGMIVAASTTLLADSRAGERGGVLPRALLAVGSAASLAANVAVAQPTRTGRVIAAWPSFALIGAYELLMRQVRRSAAASANHTRTSAHHRPSNGSVTQSGCARGAAPPGRHGVAMGPPAAVAVGGGSFSGRRGTGRWLTRLTMARCPAGVTSPASTAGTSGGAAWSNTQAPQASSISAPSPANQACAWSSNSHRPQANDRHPHGVTSVR
jgi:hypothetical protein